MWVRIIPATLKLKRLLW